MRDLLRGDPDTDVTIVFDRDENAEYVKQELKMQQQQDQELDQELQRLEQVRLQQQAAAAAEALVTFQQEQQQQLQKGGQPRLQLGRQQGLEFDADSRSLGGVMSTSATPLLPLTPIPVSLTSAQRMLTSLAPVDSSPVPPAVVTRAGATPTTVRKTVTFKRQLVRMSDVRLATLLGDPSDGIGYINLSGGGTRHHSTWGGATLSFYDLHDLKPNHNIIY